MRRAGRLKGRIHGATTRPGALKKHVTKVTGRTVARGDNQIRHAVETREDLSC